MPARAKLTEEQVKTIRRRVRAGERVGHLAAEYTVNRKTIRRRIDGAERAEAESAGRSAATRAPENVPWPPGEGEERPTSLPSAPQPVTVGRGFRGVLLFPDTPEGQAARFAHYEERRLGDPPYSIWDSNAVRRGELTAAERRHLRRTGR